MDRGKVDGMKVRVVIAKLPGTETHTAILHWPGGVRFKTCGSLEACQKWLDDSMGELLEEFEIVYDETVRITPKKVGEP